MLACLRVRNFAIIEELEVELHDKLNIVTGETGAGKSILVDALQLVLGARGRPEVVRTGAESAEIEALFTVEEDTAAAAALKDQGVENDGELVIRRVVTSSGRTRAYINGRLATLTQLRDVTKGLADISSQHEYHALIDPRQHLTYLDGFAELESRVNEMRDLHATLVNASGRLQTLVSEARGRAEREDLLRFQVSEIDALKEVLVREAELIQERGRLQHAELLGASAGEAERRLYSDDDAICTELARIGSTVERAAQMDSELDRLVSQLREASIQLEDVARELGRYALDLTVDPVRLSEIEEQLGQVSRLKRKYGSSIDEVLAHRDRADQELALLDRYEERFDLCQREYDDALDRATAMAMTLREERRRASKALSAAISEELASLGMGEARVTVELAPIEGGSNELRVHGARLSPTGVDRAEFLIAPNRGEKAKPLRKIASGGELSRAMLAVKRVLAGLGPAGLYVFDEVDAGVGGAIAEVIGKKIHEVARHSQVLCVTHLPQISAYADAHYRVHKLVVGDRTKSNISRLTERERLEEIARMLGGRRVTKHARAAAEALLRGAAT